MSAEYASYPQEPVRSTAEQLVIAVDALRWIANNVKPMNASQDMASVVLRRMGVSVTWPDQDDQEMLSLTFKRSPTRMVPVDLGLDRSHG